MPQFVVIAKDQPGALERRMATRPEHLAKVAEAAERGEEIVGGAMLDDSGEMCGSILVFDVENRERVWGEITVMPYKIAPVFAHLLKK